jgi:hypothetical protein
LRLECACEQNVAILAEGYAVSQTQDADHVDLFLLDFLNGDERQRGVKEPELVSMFTQYRWPVTRSIEEDSKPYMKVLRRCLQLLSALPIMTDADISRSGCNSDISDEVDTTEKGGAKPQDDAVDDPEGRYMQGRKLVVVFL